MIYLCLMAIFFGSTMQGDFGGGLRALAYFAARADYSLQDIGAEGIKQMAHTGTNLCVLTAKGNVYHIKKNDTKADKWKKLPLEDSASCIYMYEHNPAERYLLYGTSNIIFKNWVYRYSFDTRMSEKLSWYNSPIYKVGKFLDGKSNFFISASKSSTIVIKEEVLNAQKEEQNEKRIFPNFLLGIENNNYACLEKESKLEKKSEKKSKNNPFKVKLHILGQVPFILKRKNPQYKSQDLPYQDITIRGINKIEELPLIAFNHEPSSLCFSVAYLSGAHLYVHTHMYGKDHTTSPGVASFCTLPDEVPKNIENMYILSFEKSPIKQLEEEPTKQLEEEPTKQLEEEPTKRLEEEQEHTTEEKIKEKRKREEFLIIVCSKKIVLFAMEWLKENADKKVELPSPESLPAHQLANGFSILLKRNSHIVCSTLAKENKLLYMIVKKNDTYVLRTVHLANRYEAYVQVKSYKSYKEELKQKDKELAQKKTKAEQKALIARRAQDLKNFKERTPQYGYNAPVTPHETDKSPINEGVGQDN